MGKSIEESIKELEILKKNTFSYMPAHQAFTTAVNIMRKYQKIEKLFNEPFNPSTGAYPMLTKICKIVMEVEDGKTN